MSTTLAHRSIAIIPPLADSIEDEKKKVAFDEKKNVVIEIERLSSEEIKSRKLMKKLNKMLAMCKEAKAAAVSSPLATSSLPWDCLSSLKQAEDSHKTALRSAEDLAETKETRSELIHKVMYHQETCRLWGRYDPEGTYAISSNLSMPLQIKARERASLVTKELESYQADEESRAPKKYPECGHASSMASLALDYYFDCVHPCVGDPKSLLGKLIGLEV